MATLVIVGLTARLMAESAARAGWKVLAMDAFGDLDTQRVSQAWTAASKGAPPLWLSTNPAGKTRIAEIEQNLPKVMPLYERARKTRVQ